MTESGGNPQNLTFERRMEVLAEKIAARVCEDPRSLYPRLLTIAQATKYLGLQRDDIDRLIARHKIRNVSIDRRILLDRDDLNQWIKDNKLGWA